MGCDILLVDFLLGVIQVPHVDKDQSHTDSVDLTNNLWTIIFYLALHRATIANEIYLLQIPVKNAIMLEYRDVWVHGKLSSARPSSTTCPAYITIIRCAASATNARSCVIRINDIHSFFAVTQVTNLQFELEWSHPARWLVHLQ